MAIEDELKRLAEKVPISEWRHGKISETEIRIFVFFLDNDGWWTNQNVCDKLNLNPNTVKRITRKLVDRRVLETVSIFPGNRYRYKHGASRESYYGELSDAYDSAFVVDMK